LLALEQQLLEINAGRPRSLRFDQGAVPLCPLLPKPLLFESRPMAEEQAAEAAHDHSQNEHQRSMTQGNHNDQGHDQTAITT